MLVGLFVVLLVAAAVARRSGGAPVAPDEPSAGVPVASSANWLADHDYRVMAQLTGHHRTLNLTVVRRGDVVRGDVQTLDGQGGLRRHCSVRSWVTSQTSDCALQSLRTSTLRDLGSVGDAEMYRDAGGNTLFMIDGRPAQVVVHGRDGGERVFRISSRG